MATIHDKPTVGIEEEIQKSYLDYAMSVIVGRALPDLRDGLKPVHRRILYAMHTAGNLWNRPYRKAARVVGDVIGQYHPHGDAAVYDSVVRMAQPFSMRYPFVDGQGNFGSVDGDAPAAMRYTEVRMHRICEALLHDIDKDTVDFLPNYDNTQQEPSVLPCRFPVLLVSGSQGIAVGMATNIPPHNIGEIIDATIHLIRNPEAEVEELMEYVPGPDFPTAATILGTDGIVQAYKTGRGAVRLRAKAEVEDAGKGYERIVITEIPYLVNKAKAVESVAELVKDKKITGIRDIRDESDRQGLRVVFELKRDEIADVVLNQLYRHTQFQTTFGIHMVSIDKGRPRALNLKQTLQGFIDFRKEVVIRRTNYELARAKERAHILEGLKIALDHMDEVIKLIRAAQSPEVAREGLMAQFELSQIQAQAILDMRLQRLTALERDKIIQELKEIMETIEGLEALLASEQKIFDVIISEMEEIREKYGDPRRTVIERTSGDMLDEDLIPRQDMVVTFSRKGYVKRVQASQYNPQRPGGKGRIAARIASEDVVHQIMYASSHDVLLCFSNKGRVHWMRVFQIPEESPYSRGKAIINLLKLEHEEKIRKILAVKNLETEGYVLMATAKGKIKKTKVSEFSRPRSTGLIALTIEEDDELIDVSFAQEGAHTLLATSKGKAIRFEEVRVRPMGRQARGVTGIRMKKEDRVIGMQVISNGEGTLLTITGSGFGKRTPLCEYRLTNRGGQGVINIKDAGKKGDVVGIQMVEDHDHLLILTSGGRIIRLRMEEVSAIGRNTVGRTLVRMAEGEVVVDVTRADTLDEVTDEDLPEKEAAGEDDQPDAPEDESVEE